MTIADLPPAPETAEGVTIGVVIDRNTDIGMLAVLERFSSSLTSPIDIVLLAIGVDNETSVQLMNAIHSISDATLLFVGDDVDADFCRLIILDQAIGDWILLVDADHIDLPHWQDLLNARQRGYDIVVSEMAPSRHKFFSDTLRGLFLALYKRITGLPILDNATKTRLYSRGAALYLLSRRNAEMLLACSDLGPGFPACVIRSSAEETARVERSYRSSLTKAYRALHNANALPLRASITIALIAAFLNLLYSVYAVASYAFVRNVAPGWLTLSLEISGMFFLFSILFVALGESLTSIEQAARYRIRYTIIREVRSRKSRRHLVRNVAESS